MSDIPSPLTYGEVVGLFNSLIDDSADPGLAPDMPTLNGVCYLSPETQVFRVVSGVKRTLIGTTVPTTIQNGVLIGKDGNPGVRMLASDSPGVSPGVDDGPDARPFRYTATIVLEGVSVQPPPIVFLLPGGTQVDLADHMPVVAPGSVPVVTEETRIAAEDAATRAEDAATRAENASGFMQAAPSGTPAGYVPVTNADGSITWVEAPPGAPGPSGTITDVTATGLSSGSAPTVVLGGTPEARTIGLGIPAGVAGPAGTITSITISGLPAGSSPTVTLGGPPEARTIALGIPKGDLGDPGPAGTITGITVSGLAAGATPTATLGGTPSARTIALGIPAGADGAAGTITGITVSALPNGSVPTVTLGGTPSARTIALGIPSGADGAAGTITSVTASGLAAGASPTITLGGTPQARTIALGIPAGATGPANTLAIGTVTTGAAGSPASATITGSAPNQTLNLTLPQGVAGTTPTVDYNVIGFIRIKYTGSAWPDRTATLTARGLTPASYTGDLEWYSVGYPDIPAPGSAIIGDDWWEESPST